jgi:hypothetical protein
MIMRLVVAGAVVLVAVVLSLVLRRRTAGADAPTQPVYEVPKQLDRDDFTAPETPWLVVLFSSAGCHTCADVRSKVEVLRTREVAVDDVEYPDAKALHEKYRIDGVPCVVLADDRGVVRASFLGPVTATDLWAAVAEARQPGTSPEPDLGRRNV